MRRSVAEQRLTTTGVVTATHRPQLFDSGVDANQPERIVFAKKTRNLLDVFHQPVSDPVVLPLAVDDQGHVEGHALDVTASTCCGHLIVGQHEIRCRESAERPISVPNGDGYLYCVRRSTAG